jgi:nucleoside 2-deoxyribosyltransferase
VIYLACPYSSPFRAIREERYRQANRAAARLIDAGHVVFSPISMSHPIEDHMVGPRRPTDWWIDYDLAFMRVCDELIVLRLPGWGQSRGVAREIAWFERERLPIGWMDPE